MYFKGGETTGEDPINLSKLSVAEDDKFFLKNQGMHPILYISLKEVKGYSLK